MRTMCLYDFMNINFTVPSSFQNQKNFKNNGRKERKETRKKYFCYVYCIIRKKEEELLKCSFLEGLGKCLKGVVSI